MTSVLSNDMASGQNSEDRWDGASEPSDSNFIYYGRRLRGGRSIARRAVAPGGKAD